MGGCYVQSSGAQKSVLQRGGGGRDFMLSQTRGGKFRYGNFAEISEFCVVNFADTPRNVVACRVLRAW